MRKKYLNEIIKNIKKGRDMKGISFMPTIEEADYLQNKGIDCTVFRYSRSCLISDTKYLVESTSLELAK